jgi:type I restriction enzyme S subunit
MQVQKARKGYKLVKSLFGKYEEIPDDWNLLSLGNLCKIRRENNIQSNLYIGLEHIGQGSNSLTGKGNTEQFTSTKNIFRKGDVLYGKLRPLLNKVWLSTEDGFCSTDILPIQTNEKLDNRILEKILSSDCFVDYASSSSAGTKMPRTNWSDIQKYEIKLPPLKEQQKIASILSNVDSQINQTQKEIEQTQRLKKGLMQKLLTRGIGHTKFKKVNLGKSTLNVKIPEDWQIKQLKSVVTVENNPINLNDDEFYKRIIVKRRHEGIELRDIVKGKEILTKNQFQVLSGQFIISRRQIIHNACCMVPDSFNNSVVSNEYSIFSGSKFLLIAYLDWFSQTKLFKNMIILTTHGVHLEKYVFKLEQWLKLFMPIPPIKEQQKIASILSNVDSQIQKQQEYKSKLESLKKGLMQKLLTGQIRVKV